MHSIVLNWLEAKKTVGKYNSTSKLTISEDVFNFLVFSDDLEKVKDIPGFRETYFGSSNPLTQTDKFISNRFEILIASLGVREKKTVDFIMRRPESSQKTPDIKFSDESGLNLFAECKHKDPVPLQSIPENPDLLELSIPLSHALRDWRSGNQVIIISASLLDERVMRSIVRAVEIRVNKGITEETFIIPKVGCTVIMRDKVPFLGGQVLRKYVITEATDKPDNYQIKLKFENVDYNSQPSENLPFADMPILPGSNYGIEDSPWVMRDGKAEYEYSNQQAYYLFNAHFVHQVLSSFLIAKKQLPKNERGLIYIKVDTGSVIPSDISGYLYLQGAAMKTELTIDTNTRISAIILIAGPLLYEPINILLDDDRPMWFIHVVKNKYSLGFDKITIPYLGFSDWTQVVYTIDS